MGSGWYLIEGSRGGICKVSYLGEGLSEDLGEGSGKGSAEDLREGSRGDI